MQNACNDYHFGIPVIAGRADADFDSGVFTMRPQPRFVDRLQVLAVVVVAGDAKPPRKDPLAELVASVAELAELRRAHERALIEAQARLAETNGELATLSKEVGRRGSERLLPSARLVAS